MSYRASLFRWLRRWHARIGLAAALFFVFLVVSGIALNHTESLRLDERKLSAQWLGRWYGLHAEVPARGFKLGDRYLTWDAQQWVLDTTPVARDLPPPLGAVRVGEVCYVATRDTLFLFAADGRLIDKVTGEALPALPLTRLGAVDNRVVIASAQGIFASSDGIDWQRAAGEPSWSLVETLPADRSSALQELYAPAISSERLLLDLHSGRIFGRFGPLVIDAAALGLLALAISGVWMYLRAARAQRQRDRAKS